MPRSTIREKLERSVALIEEASKQGVQIILGGELCTTDYDRFYGTKDVSLFAEAEPIPGPSTEVVGELTGTT